MRKMVIGIAEAVAVLVVGLLTWNAEATPLTGAADVRPGTNYSLVERAGCSGQRDACPSGWGQTSQISNGRVRCCQCGLALPGASRVCRVITVGGWGLQPTRPR